MTIAEKIVNMIVNLVGSGIESDVDKLIAHVQSILDEHYGKKIVSLNDKIEFISKQNSDMNLHNIELMKKLRNYGKPIGECLEIIELLPVETDSEIWHQLGDLISKLEAMKGF